MTTPDRLFNSLDRNRILRANVKEPLGRANRVTPDDHSLDHRIRIALEDSPVHIGARITLITVTNNIFLVTPGLAGKFPFHAGRKSGTAPPPEPARFHFLNDFLRRITFEDFRKRGKPVVSDIIFQALGIDNTAIAKNNSQLF
ncbi:MAG: hypothetical protein BWY42_01750 [Candidatus Omnitrophica bacterium ADurb.Bin277]|nr:MAG: hypothetical protein BWY42_01750 [Candidatus Omnitrophica bacterium ADurb.Bin277]